MRHLSLASIMSAAIFERIAKCAQRGRTILPGRRSLPVSVPRQVDAVMGGKTIGGAERPAGARLDLQGVKIALAGVSTHPAAIREYLQIKLDHAAAQARIGDDRTAMGHHAIMAKHTAKTNRENVAGGEPGSCEGGVIESCHIETISKNNMYGQFFLPRYQLSRNALPQS